MACWIELAVLGGEWTDALQRLTNRCRERLRHSLGYVNKCNRYLAKIATFIYKKPNFYPNGAGGRIAFLPNPNKNPPFFKGG